MDAMNAVNILDQATRQLNANRDTHSAIVNALNVLRALAMKSGNVPPVEHEKDKNVTDHKPEAPAPHVAAVPEPKKP